MKRLATSSAERSVFACQVTACATLSVDPEELAQLRRNPGSCHGLQWGPSLLKHSEDQTVAALAVTVRALARQPQLPPQLRNWGVVAAPTLFGREPTAVALGRFQAEGAWGITPHMIPHYTLHAVSGTISQAFRIHGPNVGVSGGPGSSAEAFLIAASLLGNGSLPGLLLVLTGYDREKFPREAGPGPAIRFEAVALALEAEGSGLVLRTGLECADEGPLDTLSLGRLRSTLDRDDWHIARWRLPCVGWLELQRRGADAKRGCP